MQHRRDIGPNSPTLIPVAGNCDRKPRSLEREVTTIGRARGSDLCLEANEISTLHCIIYRGPDGYRIRDCNSRCGTRINGESVKIGRLNDGDIVNLGPFSFEFRVPSHLFPQGSGHPDPTQIEHWKRSRTNLAQLAMKLRKRLHNGVSKVNEQEWAQKAHLLKEKVRCYDQRLRELEEAEEELTEERAQLEREAESQRQHVQEVEGSLSRRLAQADEEIRQRWAEFQQRCQAEEPKSIAAKPAESLGQENHEIEDLRRHLHDIEDQLLCQQDQVRREQEEFTIMKEQWVNAQTKSSAALEDQQAALSAQESALRGQKAELARMMGELKKMQEDLRKHARADVRLFQDDLDRKDRENAELRAALEELERSVQAPDGADHDVEELREQVHLLHEELDTKEATLRELKQHFPVLGAEAGKLRAENELLKKLLAEKNESLDEMAHQQGPPGKSEGDLERYEVELNEFRRQLEGDRNKLNQEVEMLRERNKELDEAVREMEMEMSKERADLARERGRLERVREEVKIDMERMQREASVRDSLAPVQKLRDEINGKQAKGEKPLNDRLRSLRNQLNDTPTASS